MGTKFRENGQKLRKSRNLIPTKFNTFKVASSKILDENDCWNLITSDICKR